MEYMVIECRNKNKEGIWEINYRPMFRSGDGKTWLSFYNLHTGKIRRYKSHKNALKFIKKLEENS
jgi:hypothetical protein